ncbi:iron-sulfur cluster assembly protein [Porphyromonadaceae bacterium OttesenSCG-928-L07]|nr:iron-sulfur cluster assembly protein [Porphyromonadaceae bacterium OttesenSCG-928-L07]MDL2251532.1 iron-sulfur cluster assembly protein [Odoribacter sp. OttesenSCG-928-J03]
MENELLKRLVIEKLSTVYDPEIPVNIWELGLIYNIEFPKTSEVIITMTLTAPGCPIADEIIQQVHDTVKELDGVDAVTVNLVFEPAWTPEKMSEAARLELGFDI